MGTQTAEEKAHVAPTEDVEKKPVGISAVDNTQTAEEKAQIASTEGVEKKPVGISAADNTQTAEEKAQVEADSFQDSSFMQDLLGALPGVDINAPRIQEALKEGNDDNEPEKKDDS